MDLKRRFREIAPQDVSDLARSVRKRLGGWRHRGDTYECPICRKSYGSLLPAGDRPDAICPGCRSMERHRKMVLVLERATSVLEQRQRVLHIAPEPALRRWLAQHASIDYVNADLMRRDVDMQLDITRMDLPDGSFDGIICSHVLEHVDNDIRALQECARVLRPGGWALLNVPCEPGRELTYEDRSITTEAGRLAAFGQNDHVRIYGRADFLSRVRHAGFTCTDDFPISAEESERFRLTSTPDWDAIVLARLAP